MTVTLPDLVQPLKWDGADFDKGIQNAITKGTALGNIFGNIASTAISGAFNLVGQGIGFVSDQLQAGIADWQEAQDIQAQTMAVLESTGGVAGVTAEQVMSLADAFELSTKFAAEQTLTGENLLLTFTNIGQDVFPLATETMLDMSQALGQDVKSSAIQLGKALQDPITGVTALRRVGVNFSDAQIEVIKNLVNTNQLAEAQTLILDELQTEFGGSAVAAGQTFSGQLEILNNKMGAIRENIAGQFMPVLQDLAGRFSTWLSSPEVQEGLDNFTNWISQEAVPWITDKLAPAVADFAQNAAVQFQDFSERTQDEGEAIKTHWGELTEAGRTLFSDLLERDIPSMAEVGETALQAIDIVIYGITKALEKMKEWIDKARTSWEQLKAIGAATGVQDQGGINWNAGGPGFASGGSFVVPPGFGGDSFPMRVSSGEKVTVETPGQQQQNNINYRQLQQSVAMGVRDALLQADRGR